MSPGDSAALQQVTLPDPAAPALDDVTVVSVAYDCPAADLEYLDAFVQHVGGGVLMDNGPRPHLLADPRWKRVAPAANLGFGAAANLAVAAATTPLVLFLNPDVRVDAAAVRRLHDVAATDPSIAGVGPSQAPANSIYEANAGGADKTLLNALVFAVLPARALPRRQIWRSVFPAGPTGIDWVSGACLLFRKDAFLAAGGFSDRYFLYDEDVALGLEVRRRGYRLLVAGDVTVTHRVGGSQRDEAHFKRWALSNQRHVFLTARSGLTARITLSLLCLGLLRRATWRSFLGRSTPGAYARWSLRYFRRYGGRLPPAQPELPD